MAYYPPIQESDFQRIMREAQEKPDAQIRYIEAHPITVKSGRVSRLDALESAWEEREQWRDGQDRIHSGALLWLDRMIYGHPMNPFSDAMT